jgi:excisionase family DNA binding protein
MNRDGVRETVAATQETISVLEAARILGLSRDGAYAAAARGELPVIRIGRKLLVPRRRLMAMLEAPEKGSE